MNPKLIIASLTGVGVLGGSLTGCYYYCGQKTSQKQKITPSNEESTTKAVDAPSSETLGTQNPPNQPSSASTDNAQPNTVAGQNQQGQETTRASEGAGGASALPGAG